MNKFFKDLMFGLNYDVNIMMCCEGRSKRVAWVLAIVSYFRFIFQLITCKVIGHDLEDHGYGGPESGCTDVSCNRCGISYGKTWLY